MQKKNEALGRRNREGDLRKRIGQAAEAKSSQDTEPATSELLRRRVCQKTFPSQLQGQKRSAEANPEDLRDDVVAAVTVKGPPWFETATGVQLDENMVNKGMDRKRKDLEDFDVYDEVPVEDFARAQQDGKSPKLVGSDWVSARKPDESARARCVATQTNYGTEIDTFAATPTVVGLRILLLRALQKGWRVRSVTNSPKNV